MIRIRFQQAVLPLAILTGMAVMFGPTLPRLGAAQQDQQSQQDQQTQKDQRNQQNQDQTQTDQQPKKKKGGILGGIKSMTGSSSEQTKETATMGTKGALDGKQIAEMTPTAADRQKVADMENYSIPQGDLKKFQDDGHLQPNK